MFVVKEPVVGNIKSIEIRYEQYIEMLSEMILFAPNK